MTCEELEAERVFLQQSRDTAQSLVNGFDTALMYNWWNRYLQGCIPGLMGTEIEKLEKAMTRDEFNKRLVDVPRFGKLIRFYMEETA